MKSPAFRFYPSDFWGSPDVQLMELGEVGAYLSLMSNAWLGERYGYLADDDDKLRRWARMSRDQWQQSRDLLLTKFPVVEPGWRANPRLLREAQKMEDYSTSRSENGRKGGRPRKHMVSGENHMESIGESIEKLSVSVSASVSASKKKPPTPSEQAKGLKVLSPSPSTSAGSLQRFLDGWNGNCGPLPTIRQLTPTRKAKLRGRLAEGLIVEDFIEAAIVCAATPFLIGENARRWRASFDFLIDNDTNLSKVLEGKYGPLPASKPHVVTEDDFELKRLAAIAAHEHEQAQKVSAA